MPEFRITDPNQIEDAEALFEVAARRDKLRGTGQKHEVPVGNGFALSPAGKLDALSVPVGATMFTILGQRRRGRDVFEDRDRLCVVLEEDKFLLTIDYRTDPITATYAPLHRELARRGTPRRGITHSGSRS